MLGTSHAMVKEGRGVPRSTSLLRASIITDGGSSVDCVIRNVSSRGARLKLGADVFLFGPFDLAIAQRGKTYRADVIWRSQDTMGVAFSSRAPTVDEEMRALEQENESLRAILRDLTARLEAFEGTVAL